MEEQREPITIRMKPSLKVELHALAVSRRQKLWEVAEEAIQSYLGSRDGDGPDAGPRFARKHWPLAETLSKLLAVNSPDDTKALGLILNALLKQAESRHKEP